MRGFLRGLAEKRFTLIAILAICLLLRVGLALYKGDAEVRQDAYDYVQIARNIADGKGFVADAGYGAWMSGHTEPTAHGYVLYPAFLALLFYLLDAGILYISLVQAIIDTLSCLILYKMARRFAAGPVTGAVAALIYAVYPPFILSACSAMTETLAIFVILTAAYAFTAAFERSTWAFAAAGALMGVGIFSKSSMLAFPFIVAFVTFCQRGRVKSWLPKAALYLVAAYLVISPWTVRNYLVFHKFVPLTTNSGMVLWGGTGPADGVCLGGWEYPVDTSERNIYDNPRIPDVSEETYQKITSLQARIHGKSETERDEILKRAAFREIREHPGRYAWLFVKKFVRFWFNLWHDFPPSTATLLIAPVNFVLLLLAILGYRRMGVNPSLKHFSLAIVLYTMLLSMLTLSQVRFNYTVMPFVILLAGAQLSAWLGVKMTVAESSARDEETVLGV